MKKLHILWLYPDKKFLNVLEEISFMGHKLTVVKKSDVDSSVYKHIDISFLLESEINQDMSFDLFIYSSTDVQSCSQKIKYNASIIIEESLNSSDLELSDTEKISLALLDKDKNELFSIKKLATENRKYQELEEKLYDIIVDFSRTSQIPYPERKKKEKFFLEFPLDNGLKTLKCILERYDPDSTFYLAENILYHNYLGAHVHVKRYGLENFIFPRKGQIVFPKEKYHVDTIVEAESLLTFELTENKLLISFLSLNNHHYFFDHFKNLLVVDDKLHAHMLSKEETNEIVEKNKKNQCEKLRKQGIIHSFLEQVSKVPGQKAVQFYGKKLTYEVLEVESNKIAYALKERYGSLNNIPIGLAISKSLELLPVLLAILKVGAHYIPLDYSYPKKRIKKILQQVKPKFIITNDKFQYNMDLTEYKNLVNFKDLNIIKDKEKVPLLDTSFNIAYKIFTSGSTGEPKGVEILQNSVVNLAKGAGYLCKISPEDRVLNVASMGFDAAGWDIYGALLNGATVVLTDEDTQKDPEKLLKVMREEKISFATLTPAVLASLSEHSIPSLKKLVIMGDKIPKNLFDFWSTKCEVWNGYGPTETTIGSSLSKYDKNKSSACIGKPMPNYYYYVVDKHNNLVPKGVIGELLISGLGLAKGYVNDEKLTEEKFIHLNIHNILKNERAYKTGDLVFVNENSEYEFVGRKDYQVKIRGVRIELQEIENNILEIDFVKNCLVVPEKQGDQVSLVAYIELQKDSDTIDMQFFNDHILKSLHPAAVPNKIYFVKKFNLTVNGKIDRKKLPEITNTQSLLQKKEPNTLLEKKLSLIFEEVLNIKKVYIDESFFMLGGHSLIATKVISRINKEFGADLKIKDIFINPSVEMLSRIINMDPVKDIKNRIEVLDNRVGSLTFSQDRLWYLYNLDKRDTSYNLPLALTLSGELDINKLQESLNYIVKWHESFRTVFFQTATGSQQKILNEFHHKIIIENCSQKRLQKRMRSICSEPFDLEDKPAVRVYLFKTGKNTHVLFFVKHNIVTDAWSEGVIIKELINTYNDLITKNDLSNKKIDVQCLDYAHYQKKYLTKDYLKKQIDYWQNKLSGYQNLNFPVNERPDIPLHKGKRYSYTFNKEAWSKLKEYGRKNDLTPFVVVLSLINLLCAKYAGQTDVTLGTALSGRIDETIENTSGFFVNTLPIRTIFDENTSFSDITNLVKKSCFESYDNQDIPFEEVVNKTNAERYLNKNPIFQIMVILQNADEVKLPKMSGLEVTSFPVSNDRSMFDLGWNFQEEYNVLTLDLDYDIDLFDEPFIQSIIQVLEEVMFQVSQNVHLSLSNLSWVNDKMMQKVISLGSGKNCIFKKEDNVVKRFLDISTKNKYKVGLKGAEKNYTYTEIKNYALSIACVLHKLKSNEQPLKIGILLDRNEFIAFSILGCLFAGCIYIPIDKEAPKERIFHIINDAEIDYIFVNRGYKDIEIKNMIYIENAIKNAHTFMPLMPKHSDTVYILYTSGTTGVPKGVEISHLNLLNLCDDFINRINLNPTSYFLSVTSVGFDIFGLELFCPLLSGAYLDIAPTKITKNPVKLVNYINEKKPTHIQGTPTLWSAIVDHLMYSSFCLLCGGEAMSPALRNKLIKNFNNSLNVYGPTETTIWSSVESVSSKSSIGKPIQNTQFVIIDNKDKILPINCFGELAIGGNGVGKGYLRREELTREKFITLSIGNEKRVFYKTGDLVRLDFSGNFLFFGRKDSQIKLRGHRIELQEIEEVAGQHPFVQQVAIKMFGEALDAYLAAFVVLEPGNSFNDILELREFMSEKLPNYMLPSVLVVLDMLPINTSGKIARDLLIEPDKERISHSDSKYIPPSTKVEKIIQEIWEEIIGKQQISIKDNFFAIGGHSLHIPVITFKINKLYNTHFTIRDFILNSTIEENALMVENSNKEKKIA